MHVGWRLRNERLKAARGAAPATDPVAFARRRLRAARGRRARLPSRRSSSSRSRSPTCGTSRSSSTLIF
ncbi:MAG: hypothetical protein MZV64_04540 [Ignavibacteriales bacterium]|nr:hypothetical protein [Ignavibacteriales bacterium]